MKTFIQNILNVLFTLILFSPAVYNQTLQAVSGNALQKVTAVDRVCTVIDVKGSRFSDRMWIFSIPECTRGFDNGWDGYKMLGSLSSPQLFSMEAAGNFQVNSIPDINDTYLGFRAGEDSMYTLTFTNYFVATRYSQLYLVDLLENKTIDIFTTGAQYTFVAKNATEPQKRFKIVSVDIPPVIIPENHVTTIIDVQGSRYADKLSIISDSTCTSNFDKGWDTYKTFGSPLNPQLYAWEADGNYQINAVNDINDTYLGFLPGEDTNYTLKFTNYNLKTRYQELYLMDLLENKTIDIYTSGAEYSFVAAQTNTPVKRFKIVTSIPNQEIDINSKDKKEPTTDTKKLKIFNSQKTIIVDNPNAGTGYLTLYNVQSGRMVSQLSFNGNGITTIQTDVPEGIYILKGITANDMITERVMIR